MEGSPQAAASKRGKKSLIAGIVVVAIIALGAIFWVWHNTPGFCSTVCHTPMDAYVETYEAPANSTATDKWGNAVSNSNSMLAVSHKSAGTGCLSCHVPSIGQQVSEVQETITGDYYYPLEEVTISGLLENSGAESTNETEFCLKSGCHTDSSGAAITSRDQLVDLTSDMKINPHSSYHGTVDCSNCHKSHRASVFYCTQCHTDAKSSMPEGWVDYETGQKIEKDA